MKLLLAWAAMPDLHLFGHLLIFEQIPFYLQTRFTLNNISINSFSVHYCPFFTESHYMGSLLESSLVFTLNTKVYQLA